MAYGICRIAKLKSSGAIAASEQHTCRQRFTPNADPTKTNERFIGSPLEGGGGSLSAEVLQRIGRQKIRKDAVLCVEILLTASPEFFRPGAVEKAGKWDDRQLEEWKRQNQQWLQAKFGDRIVRAELHLDEATPHIHAYLVPLDAKGKLNCKSFFGGREKLSQFQDSYAEAMAPLGLERGIKGSRATHTQVKEYYAAVVKSPEQGLTQSEIDHQLADRFRVMQEKADLERTAKQLIQEQQRLHQQIRDLQDQVDLQQQETQNWKRKYQTTTDQLREIPLEQVAIELGLHSDPNNTQRWQNASHRINMTGSKFYDFQQQRGGGGAIDLVMQVEGCNFKAAVRWLHDRFGESETLATITRQTQTILAEQPRQPFIPPTPNQQQWQAVRQYLTQSCKLPGLLVDRLHDQGLIYADADQNLVFLRRSLDTQPEVTGARLRSISGNPNSPGHLAYGSRRSQGWFYLESAQAGPIQRVVLCQGEIELLSYCTLHPAKEKTIYLAIEPSGKIPLQQLQEIPEIVLALNQDPLAQEYFQRLQQQFPTAKLSMPGNKDWNMELRQQLQRFQQQAGIRTLESRE